MAGEADKRSRLKLEPHQIVLRPLITEKGTHQSTRYNSYPFEVNPLATKEDIKQAVELLWNVRVVRVRTQHRAGKPRRTRFRRGTTSAWKKAIVTLDQEHRMNFF